jgi:non-specific serine/threonine protein kinase/serine/threonine-protein kinase
MDPTPDSSPAPPTAQQQQTAALSDQPYASANLAHVVAAVRELKHPTQIGPYHILEPIGEGGMGIVYRAEQREPIHRIVAVKIIKLGMDTRQVIARFESERQALAVMNHVNVAKVLDAGATENGRPYFVMEYVPGEPITTFADRHKLPVRQRLALFAQACDAVQHAHQKAIIHRDLKPSNILVTFQDDRPLVKVIDFGVAKATAQKLTERTLFTETGQFVGTPEYMAPEQADAGAVDVDTRSDIYSLGVVLYELLSGALPFDSKSLRSAAYGEIQRIIREVEPPKPSTRLSTMRDALPSVAAMRQIEPRKLGTLLRGELDWIVMKALEKDRTRRYESASALAADVNRFLSNEPVSAGRPGGLYRARKFVRRHRVGLTMAALLVLALGAGLIGTTWGFIRARHERDEAVAARAAEAEAREYEAQTDKFLIGMFTSINPEEARGRDVLVKEILERAARRIDAQPPKHNVVEASLRAIFGRAYQALGMPERAREHLDRAVELYRKEGAPRQRFLMRELSALGEAYATLGQTSQAESTLREALRLHAQALGENHPDTIVVEADLASTLMHMDRLADADAALADAMTRMDRAPPGSIDADARASVANVLGNLRARQGRYAEAEQLLRDTLAKVRAEHGADHPTTITLTNNLAHVLQDEGRGNESLDLQRAALDLARKIDGPDHPDTLTAANNLALVLASVGRADEACQLYQDTIERRRRALGEDDPLTLVTRSNYGLALQGLGRFDEAEAIFRDVSERMRRRLGESNDDTLLTRGNLAMVRAGRGDLAEAESIFRDIVPRARAALGADNPAAVVLASKFGFILSLQQKWAEAEPYLAESYRAATAAGVASSQPGYATAYGICLANLNKPNDALPILKQADAALRAAPQANRDMSRRVAVSLASVYEQLGQPDEARRWRDAAVSSSQPAAQSAPAPATQPDALRRR